MADGAGVQQADVCEQIVWFEPSSPAHALDDEPTGALGCGATAWIE